MPLVLIVAVELIVVALALVAVVEVVIIVLLQHPPQHTLLVSTSNTKLFLKYCCYTLLTDDFFRSSLLPSPSPQKNLENFTFIPLGLLDIVGIVVLFVLLAIVSIELAVVKVAAAVLTHCLYS